MQQVPISCSFVSSNIGPQTQSGRMSGQLSARLLGAKMYPGDSMPHNGMSISVLNAHLISISLEWRDCVIGKLTSTNFGACEQKGAISELSRNYMSADHVSSVHTAQQFIHLIVLTDKYHVLSINLCNRSQLEKAFSVLNQKHQGEKNKEEERQRS